MTYQPDRDFGVEVARGNVSGFEVVLKFGRNGDIDTGTTPEDLWEQGGVWVQPTAARIHDIVSTSAADAAAGTGARTMRVCGLVDWDTVESSEVITLNGVTNVPTVNSYVIINRMEVLTAGSGATNAGSITATAQTDATVTAVITPTTGQTLMAIYGIPSVQKLYITQYDVIWNRSGGAANEAEASLVIKLFADQPDALFVTKHVSGLFGAGSTFADKPFQPRLEVVGPAIVKISCTNVSVNNTALAGGFSGFLIDN